MAQYILRLKSDNSRVDSIPAGSLKEAKQIYMNRKQMNEKTFDSLYNIEKNLK